MNPFINEQKSSCVVLKRNQTERPLVSVVVPVYNIAEYLDEALQSVLGQSLAQLEVICVNDGSTDASLDVLMRWADRDPRVSVLSQENAGLSAARNRGFDAVRAPYVFFLDGDDVLEPEALQVLYDRMEADRLDALYFDTECFADEPAFESKVERSREYYRRAHDYPAVVRGEELLGAMRANGDYVSAVWMQMNRTAFLQEAGLRFYKGIVHEDELFTFTAMLKASRAAYLPRSLYRHRIRKNSIMTGPMKFINAWSCCIVYEEMRRLLAQRELTEEAARGARSIVEMIQRAGVGRFAAASPQEQALAGQLSMPDRLRFKLFLRDKTPRSAQPKVSVVIAAGGGEETLYETLNSALDQSLEELEFVCVERGAAVPVLRQWAGVYGRLRLVTQTELSAGAARNAGVAASTGEYVTFLDAGDKLLPRSLERLYQAAAKHKLDFVKGAVRLKDARNGETEESAPLSNRNCPRQWKVASLNEAPRELFGTAVAFYGLYRTDFLVTNGLAFATLRSDSDRSFSVGCLIAAQRLMITDIPIAEHTVAASDSPCFDCQVRSYALVRELSVKLPPAAARCVCQLELNRVFDEYFRWLKRGKDVYALHSIIKEFVWGFDVNDVGEDFAATFAHRDYFWTLKNLCQPPSCEERRPQAAGGSRTSRSSCPYTTPRNICAKRWRACRDRR